jgi:outer membrane protein
MKKILLLITFFALNSFAANLKIGTVNVSKLLEKAPQVVASSQEIAKKFKPIETEILALIDKLNAMNGKYNKNKSIMSSDKARETERKIIALKKRIQRKRGDVQEEINIAKTQALQKIQDLINESITFVSKRDKYDLVIYEGIAFNSDKSDMTDLVLQRLKSIAN